MIIFPRGLLLICWLFAAQVFAEESSSLVDVNVQLKWRHQFQFAGYYAALENGFYRDAGLNVHLLERNPGPTPIEQLILGNVDYAIVGVGALIYQTNGVPLVALAAIYQHSPSILISKYPRLAELKGKRVMLSEGVMNAEITAMLSKENLTSRDINVVPTNQALDGFIRGKHVAFNGYSANEPFYLNQHDEVYYSFSPLKYDIDFYGDILITSAYQIDTHPEQVAKFRAATIKGWEYVLDHVDEIVDLILNKYNSQGKSKQQLLFEAEQLIPLIYAEIIPIGYMSEERWQAIATVLRETGHLGQQQLNLDKFLYNPQTEQDIIQQLMNHKVEIVGFIIVLVGVFLLIHNARLKLIIAERTGELIRSKQQAEIDARTDVLTGLANRRYCMEVMAHDLSIAKRNGLELSIIYMDIDWFKKINDQYGHGAGDEALKVLAKILKDNVRASDTPARIGGEEFVVICLEKDAHSACNLADRIRCEVQKTTIVYQDLSFNLTVSFGVASLTEPDLDSVDSLLKKSDEALYKAKEQGRNQVVCL